MIEKRATSEVNTKSGGTRYPKDQNYILNFEYNSDNPHQLSKVTESDPRGVRKNSIDVYTFDSAGNLESKLSNTDGKRRDLKWSAENRLQEVHQHGNIQKYTYNADGERIKKEGNNGESIYVNQFYHVRNSLLSFKHIYAGNTRIATKVVPSGNRPHKNRTQGGNQNQINVVGDPMQLDTAQVNKQLNLNGNGNGKGNNNNQGQDQNTNDKSNNGNKGNSGNNNGNQSQGRTHDNTDVVIPQDCAFPIDQVKGNVTQQQVDNWCRRNAGINPNRGNAWGRNNNNGNNPNQNSGNNNPNNHGNQGTGAPTGNNQGNQNNPSTTGRGAGQGPVNAQGNAYAWGWYANKDEYRTPPGKSRGKGTTGLKEPKIYFYHSDHLGSANYVTDVIGEVFEHTINFPFGEIWIDEGSNTSLLGFKFTGKELDEETGYYYFGARYYDPKVSVWVSTDPILNECFPSPQDVYFPEEAFNASSLKGSGGVYNSITMSLYQYGKRNPIKFIDPDGRDDEVFKAGNTNWRMDVEYISQGGDTNMKGGNIHVQNMDTNEKYYFNPRDNGFYDKNGKQLSKSVSKDLLKNQRFVSRLNTNIAKINNTGGFNFRRSLLNIGFKNGVFKNLSVRLRAAGGYLPFVSALVRGVGAYTRTGSVSGAVDYAAADMMEGILNMVDPMGIKPAYNQWRHQIRMIKDPAYKNNYEMQHMF